MVKVKGPNFEVQEYEFSEVPETSSDKFKYKADLYFFKGIYKIIFRCQEDIQ